MKTLLQLAPISAQTGTDPGPDWRTQAACLGHDPEIFFPHPSDHDGEDAAIAICSGCPVKADCLADAMKSENSRPTSRRHGIWGGKTPQQRCAMYKKEARRRGRKSYSDHNEHEDEGAKWQTWHGSD